MKKEIAVAGLTLLIAVAFIPVSCFSPYTGPGNVTVSVGSGAGRGAIVLLEKEQAAISHTVTLSGGPGGAQTKTGVKAGIPVSFSVAPGTWEITVTAYMGGGVIATGRRSVEVKAGNNTAGVDMETIGAGSGTPEDPWIVYSEELLRKVGTGADNVAEEWGLDDHYKLLGDLTLTGGFSPIGRRIGNSGGSAFTGTFDGNGRTIRNLTVGADSYGGIERAMFCNIRENAEVKNLTLENVSITNPGNTDTSGIAGQNSGKITNCSVSGAIRGSGDNNVITGGIAASNRGEIINCSVSGTVSGGGNTGGIAGYNDQGIIQNCSVKSGFIIGSGASAGGIVGGIVGIAQDGLIQNCYAESGELVARTSAGGIVGEAASNTTVIQNCVALSLSINVPVTVTAVGRIQPPVIPGASLGGNYGLEDMRVGGSPYLWLNKLTGDDPPVEGVDGTDIDFSRYTDPAWWKDPANWNVDDLLGGGDYPAGAPWDFVNVWDWDSAAKRPVLRKNARISGDEV